MTPVVAPENRRNHTTEGQAAFNPAAHKPVTHLEKLIFGRWLAAVVRCGDADDEIERLEKLRRAHEGARVATAAREAAATPEGRHLAQQAVRNWRKAVGATTMPQTREITRACERWERAVGIVDGLAEAYELVVGERKT